mmetsp:Transcript_18435/g.29995  ORF Transcript_18435/g.29995 Transcript_18435/m.29995 type:complete len:367 (+) Transcript_18435:7295-8395(+)
MPKGIQPVQCIGIDAPCLRICGRGAAAQRALAGANDCLTQLNVDTQPFELDPGRITLKPEIAAPTVDRQALIHLRLNRAVGRVIAQSDRREIAVGITAVIKTHDMAGQGPVLRHQWCRPFNQRARFSIRVKGQIGPARVRQSQSALFLVQDGGDGHQGWRLCHSAEIQIAGPGAWFCFGCIMRHSPNTIPWHVLTGVKVNSIQRLAPMALDGVAPNAVDLHHLLSVCVRFLKLDLMLPNRSGLYPWLRMIRYCWVKVIVLFAIQYTTRPLAKLPSMNMKIHGIQAKIIFCVGSVGAGFSFCCSHMEIPRRIGRIPRLKISKKPSSGTPYGRMPNRLKIELGSGAERSVIQPNHGAWRSSLVTKITL